LAVSEGYRRFPVVTTDAQGSASMPIAPATLQVVPGETRVQFYTRLLVGAGFNLSDGLGVFCPRRRAGP
jgi:hypothetical protein